MKKIIDEKNTKKQNLEEKGISLENVLENQVQEEKTDTLPKFINDDITLDKPLTYSRKD